MFKVPEWESDIPKENADFSKKNKKGDNNNIDSKHLILHPEKLNKKTNQNKVSSGSVLIKKKNKKRNCKKELINGVPNEITCNENEVSKVKEVPFIVNKPKKREVKSESKNASKKNLQIDKKSKFKMTNTNTVHSVKKASKKRKHENSITSGMSLDDTENELKAKKIKLSKTNTTNTDVGNARKCNFKKDKLKKLLEKNTRTSINVSGNKLRDRMLERLKAAQFRYLNEKLYTSSGNEAKEIFQSDPEAFKTYHQGYQQQVKKWPVNPLDTIVKKIQKMPKNSVIADMGCGEGALSKRVSQKVHSFDLVAANPAVVACDMAHTPLLGASVDVVVYCLALMGTELTQYLIEANRVLKTGGQLLIAEVESRFDDINAFTKDVEKLGFKLKNLDKEHSVFFFLHFMKNREPPAKKSKLPAIQLKPCLYKKR